MLANLNESVILVINPIFVAQLAPKVVEGDPVPIGTKNAFFPREDGLNFFKGEISFTQLNEEVA